MESASSSLLLLLQVWSGLLCTRGKESEVCLRRWTIFLVYLEKWAHGFSSFLLHRSRQTRTSEDSSCYDQSLWTLLGLSPLSWCGSLWSPGCLLTDHRVEVCSVCAVLSQITCEAGNCYWCSRLLTNVAATVICALIFFSEPICSVTAALKCSGGFPERQLLMDIGCVTRRWQQRRAVQVPAKGPGPLRQGFSDWPGNKNCISRCSCCSCVFLFFPCKHHR